MHKAKPKLPPPSAPLPNLSDNEIEAQRRKVREVERKRKGRSSTMLTGQLSEPKIGRKTLLGQ